MSKIIIPGEEQQAPKDWQAVAQQLQTVLKQVIGERDSFVALIMALTDSAPNGEIIVSKEAREKEFSADHGLRFEEDEKSGDLRITVIDVKAQLAKEPETTKAKAEEPETAEQQAAE